MLKKIFTNVEFRFGEIESLPVADESVDVIISNCVINLSPEKLRVFKEAYRVLKPGGRLAVADIVATAPLPDEVRGDWAAYTGCMAGASQVRELEQMLEAVGFQKVRIAPKEHLARLFASGSPEAGLKIIRFPQQSRP